MQMPTSSTVWWAPVWRSPSRLDGQIEAGVTGEQVEHVIEKPDAGVALARRRALERELDVYVRLGGLAVDLGGAASCRPLSRMRASIERAWSSNPSARATGAAARASSAAAVADPDLGEPAAKVSGDSPEANRAAPSGGQDVVGPGDVVAERRGRGGADEHAAGSSDPRRERLGVFADELQVLGSERLRRARAPARRPRRRRAAPTAPVSRHVRRARRGARRAVRAPPRRRPQRPGAVLGLGEQVQRERIGIGVAGRRPRTGRSARRTRRSRRRQTPGAWPPARTGSRGRRSRRRRDRLGAVGQRGDSLRPAHRVDGGRAGQTARREYRPVDRRRGQAGHTTTSGTPATRRGHRRPSRPYSDTPPDRRAHRPPRAGTGHRAHHPWPPRSTSGSCGRPRCASAPTFSVASSRPARTAGSRPSTAAAELVVRRPAAAGGFAPPVSNRAV